jgi:hypothetical protein
MIFPETVLAGDGSAKSTPAPPTLRGKRPVDVVPGGQAEDKTERFLFVMTARDPLLPQKSSSSSSPKKGSSAATGPSWTQGTSVEDTDSSQTLPVLGNTGLPSPSPSPEDGQRRKPSKNSTVQTTKPVNGNMLDTPAETSPATMTLLIQKSRSGRSRPVSRIAGNIDSKYDNVTWRDLTRFYSDLDIAIALIETENDTPATSREPGTTERLIHALVRSAELRLDKVNGTEREIPWWKDPPGSKTLVGGFIKPKYPMEVEIEMPRTSVDTEKNLNGELPTYERMAPIGQVTS